MAWTDAARAAAAEARRQHAGQKEHFSKIGKFNISADTSSGGRGEIARQLKAVRSGKMADYTGHTSDMRINQIVSNAAASTRLRNLNKAVGKQAKMHKKK